MTKKQLLLPREQNKLPLFSPYRVLFLSYCHHHIPIAFLIKKGMAKGYKPKPRKMLRMDPVIDITSQLDIKFYVHANYMSR